MNQRRQVRQPRVAHLRVAHVQLLQGRERIETCQASIGQARPRLRDAA